MKKSEHNLRVIDNFILYYTHDNPEMNCDEMYQAAKDYILEDHVDGKECEDDNIFTTDDMEKSFDAGREYDYAENEVNRGKKRNHNEPDFVKWIEKKYNIKIDYPIMR